MRHPVAETALMYIKSKPKYVLDKWAEVLSQDDDESLFDTMNLLKNGIDHINSDTDILALAFVMLQGER